MRTRLNEKNESPPPRRELLRVDAIGKSYPGVRALDDVSLSLREGEVHAIVGENGAGKSTLIKILAGAIAPSEGTITVGEESYTQLTPHLARTLGVAVIYQEFTLVPTLSAVDNVFLGEYPRIGPFLRRREMKQRSLDLFRRLGVRISPNALVESLTTGYQQIVEIAKALSKQARLLIMDEPSAPLTASEVESMYRVIDALKSEGMTIVYISHRLDEIFRLADRVTVLRDGGLVTTLDIQDTSRRELITLMVGRELNDTYPARSHELGEVTIRVDQLSGNGVQAIDFEARSGEILGFAGLIGAGRTELMELIFGSVKATDGQISINGSPVRARTPMEGIRNGVALVPEDRKRHGVVLPFSIRDNVSLPQLRRLTRVSLIDTARESALVEEYTKPLRIKAPSTASIVGQLSGGNQQKVVLAKWLAMKPEIFIFDEPTRGIDIGARHEIYLIMNRLAEQGKTILMVSSDMEELIGMSDRIVVLREGAQQGVLHKDQITQEAVMALAAEGEAA